MKAKGVGFERGKDEPPTRRRRWIELPLFNGEDAPGWEDRIIRYFEIGDVPEEDWLSTAKNGHGRTCSELVPVLGGDSYCSFLAPIQSCVGQTVSTNDGQEPLCVNGGPVVGEGPWKRRH